MNGQHMPGPGDSATWGAVTSSSDPRCVSWVFPFTAYIGIGNAQVEAAVEFYDDDPEGVIEFVLFNGVDILDTITDATCDDIRRQAKRAYSERKKGDD